MKIQPGSNYISLLQRRPKREVFGQPALVTQVNAEGHPINPRRWLDKPASFDVQNQPLEIVLRALASSQGIASQVSPSLTGTVTGKFFFADPSEFLDLLCLAQHMNWYYDGSTVYFFHNSEMQSRIFPLINKREESLRGTLIDLGLFDPRFSWKLADEGRLLLVQGPATYLDRVGDIVERQAENAAAVKAEKKLGVFRLKHAWAAEQTITTGNVNTRVPGVADLLRQILSESPMELSLAPMHASVGPGEPSFRKGTGVIGKANVVESTYEQTPDAVPFIQADTRLNAVLVWDTEENLIRHKRIIDTLDLPLALVEIRAAIIDVEADRARDLGISWEYSERGGRWQGDVGQNVGSGSDRVSYDSINGDGFQYATIYTRGLDQFMLRVSALEKNGSANILSRPSVLTQDNIQATLEHTETFYVRLEGEREVDLADITTGLTLRVTPHVISDEECGENSIQLAVYIVNGTDDYSTDSRVDNLPRVRQSTITTQAVVNEGEALVIGGYYNESRRVSSSGVPLLSKIPAVGSLFRTRGRMTAKSERLFVLSPRIVVPGQSPIIPGTEAERAMEYSPARDTLEKPAMADPSPDTENKSKRRGWAKDMLGR